MSLLRFPPELHSNIIRYATYSPVFFDISPDPRFWPVVNERYAGFAPGYETKKALMLVSHHFRYLSFPYLYEVVIVHKSSNMHLLAKVLDSKSSDSAINGLENPRKIKYLFVSVSASNHDVFSGLWKVLPHCQGLQGFGFYAAATEWMDSPQNWFNSIPKTVRVCDWQGHVGAWDFFRVVDRISESLVSLRFSKVSQYNSPPSVSLPKLSHLSMPEDHGGVKVLSNWSMPSLTHLRVNVLTSVALVRVVERAGNSLRSVILGPKVSPTSLAQIATVSQNLEEYTYHFRPGMEASWASVRSHPSLQNIVMVFRRRCTPPRSGVQSSMYTFCSHLQSLTGAHFPKLRRIGFVGFDPHSTFDAQIRARLDQLLDAWNTTGIEVEYLGP
ncbi:hypothetical protein BD410DRAFT_830482 [Rickenella mellea]|uniref:F-box domain-containing protein n=1 Tax=Rickenella mellea TaxID=50990 RepID=A0A4Y7PW97_9AGAM|nr:hypothetical protein BD410DRAFT_830482 [Rickenella mellea]